MSTLYLDRKTLRLKREGESLVLFDNDGRKDSLPLHLLTRIVARGRIELDTGTLGHIVDRGIVISLLSGRFNKQLATVSGPLHNDATRRLGQYRAYDDSAWRQAWCRRIVRSKLRAQKRLLLRLSANRPDQRHALLQGLDGVQTPLLRLDESQAPADTALLGIEGAAARAYYAALAAVLPPSLGFRGRNRRPPRDPVNAVLSLGYTLLHAEAVQAAWSAGLDPFLGYYHRPEWGRESLASDLIEPLRPLADRLAWDLFRRQTLTVDHFSFRGEACLLSKAGRQHFYRNWEERAAPARRLLRRVCARLAREFTVRGETEPTR